MEENKEGSTANMGEKMIEGRDTKKKANWLPFVVVVVAAVVLIFASGGDSDDSAKEQAVGEQSENVEVVAEEEADAGASLEGMHKLTVVEDFVSWTPGAKLENSKTVSRSLVIEGDVEKAWLYVDASVAEKELESGHSLYFMLVRSGGHLFRPETADVEQGKGTTLLYDLADMAYLPKVPYDETRTPERADLTPLLKDGSSPLVTSFISSLDEGKIHELSIYYACAEGSDCSITLR